MVADLDEFELIARYFAPLSAGEAGAFGLTDDAAEMTLPPGKRAVITTDAIVAGVHFPASDDPGAVASRVLRVNLSDLAAKGAMPRVYTLAMALPRSVTSEWIAGFCGRLAEEQREFGVTLIGGDTTRSDGALMVALTLVGEAAEQGTILRSGARVGDDVYVSGTIGDAALGLAILEKRLRATDDGAGSYLLGRYRTPLPRLELGQNLAGLASAAADVSDGLVADLGHICEASAVCAEIELERVPMSTAALAAVIDDQPLRISLLGGGDDYELVFTAPKSVSGQVQNVAQQCGVAVTKIGGIVEKGPQERAVAVRDAKGQRVEVGHGGYKHFR